MLINHTCYESDELLNGGITTAATKTLHGDCTESQSHQLPVLRPYPRSLSRGYFRPADCLGCSILGMYLFGGKFCMWADRSRPCTCAEVVSRHPMCRCDRKHFNDIVWALVTVFQVPLFLPLLPLYNVYVLRDILTYSIRSHIFLPHILRIIRFSSPIFVSTCSLYRPPLYICICIYIYTYSHISSC